MTWNEFCNAYPRTSKDGGLATSLSYSYLSSYISGGIQAFIDNWVRPWTGNRYTLLGNYVHAVVLDEQQLDKYHIIDHVPDTLEWRNALVAVPDNKTPISRLMATASHDIAAAVKRMAPYITRHGSHHELLVEAQYAGIPIKAYIDHWESAPGLLADLKTIGNLDMIEQRIDSHTNQVSLYAWLLRQQGHAVRETRMIYACTQHPYPVVQQGVYLDIDRVLGYIEALAHDLSLLDTPIDVSRETSAAEPTMQQLIQQANDLWAEYKMYNRDQEVGLANDAKRRYDSLRLLIDHRLSNEHK